MEQQKNRYSLVDMQGNKVYMLTNEKFDNLDILCYSDIVYARCVDIKVSTLRYILILAYGVILWKSSLMTLMALEICI